MNFDDELDSLEVHTDGAMTWRSHGDLEEPESTIMAHAYVVGLTQLPTAKPEAPDEFVMEPVMVMQVVGVCGSGHDHIQRWYVPVEAAPGVMKLIRDALDVYEEYRRESP